MNCTIDIYPIRDKKKRANSNSVQNSPFNLFVARTARHVHTFVGSVSQPNDENHESRSTDETNKK